MLRLKMKTFVQIIFAPLLWLLQSCSPLGDHVDKEISDNHYYNSSKTKIIYSLHGNWFEIGKHEMETDVESFEVFNRFLSKDKNQIYFKEYPAFAGEIDLSSFYVKEGDYLDNVGFDKNHVFNFEKIYKNEADYIEVSIVENANPKTYHRVDWNWGKDGEHRFYQNTKIEADYETFEVLNDYFTKDSSQIFVRRKETFEPLSADTNSFSILENTAHGIDKNYVYWLAFFTEGGPLIKIAFNAEDKVEFLNRYFLRISDTIYYDGVAMPAIDSKNFVVINQLYTKDANQVYYKNQIIEGADVETFLFSDDGMGIHDKNGMYRDGKLLREN